MLYTVLTGTAFYLWPGLVPYLKTTHVHAGLVGFFLNLVMGVAFWMMPRPAQIRQEGLEAMAYYTLNAGLLLRLVAEPWRFTAQTRACGHGWCCRGFCRPLGWWFLPMP
ncbi:hypothetical protein [Meiothermus sp. CFH 77666]|uniref:hypothetical protein n=1 Tax=Meiothermus sp. CFH 77666 TaxID=2817942 RepID=UPI001FB16060|nr:hypothetical protein [Meiothermus sp. CFH 77666]